MKSSFSHVFFLILLGITVQAQTSTWVCKTGNVSFFSEAPLENIDAKTNQAVGAINTEKNSISVKVQINTFQFKKKLMQEHFNENYMESEKFPFGTLKGTISETIDYSTPGEHDVTIKGTLEIHGVTLEREIKGKMIVQKDKIIGKSEFWVALKDHNIAIPTLVVKNIAEEILVKVDLTFEPHKK